MNKLQAARQVVNAAEFGTPEWEEAMQVVRELAAAENGNTDFGAHASIDGDI